MGLTKDVVRGALGRAMQVFFREIEVVGAPSGEVRGRIFAANHFNGLIDPIVVLTSTRCDMSPIAKSTLWDVPGLRFLLDVAEAVPVVRRRDDPDKPAGSNDEIFDKVGAHLAGGGNMLIFPEGTSHSEPRVLALKSGAARMLARARAMGGTELTFQAVGLEWDARETFRSRVLVVYGPVRRVDDLASGPEAELPKRITEKLREDLTELVVEGETWAERLLIGRIAELLTHESGSRSLAEWNAIGRKVEAAREALRGREAVYDDVADTVTRYYGLLDQAGLTDARLTAGDEPVERLMRGAVLTAILPLALVGAVLYYLPYQLPKLAPAIAKGEGDVVSTYKLGLGLVAFPAWMAVLVTCALVLVHPASVAWSLVVLAALSPFAALPWLDKLDRSRRRPSSPSALRGEPPTRERLLAARAEALSAIGRVREQVEREGLLPAAE